MRSKKRDLTAGPVKNVIRDLTIPMIFGILGMVIFNLVDTFYVGKLGTVQMAALSFTFPVVLVVNSINLGLGIGASAVISKAVGENNKEKVTRLSTDSLTLGFLVAAVLALIGELTIHPLFISLGADNEVLPYINEYMRVWYAGVPFVVIPMIGNNAIRALGDTKTPSAVMMISALINMVLDPILIFGWGPFAAMGVKGAAVATVIARGITFMVALYVLTVREKVIEIKLIKIRLLLSSWGKILFIGMPNAIAKVIIPIGAGIITRIISSFGHDYVAAFGISTRIEYFSLAILSALAAIIPVYVGQNFGGKKMGRIKEGIKISTRFSMVYSVIVYGLLFFLARPLSHIFTEESHVSDLIVLYLRIVPLGYGFQGILLIINGALNALGKPIKAALLNVVQMLIIYVPLSVLFSNTYGMKGIFISLIISYLVTGILARLMFNKELSRIL
ncbi:MAG: MATE family efflux transporter [Clostridia bacterium]|nr:MATE family efflux transporter [Clostridia bacterium]